MSNENEERPGIYLKKINNNKEQHWLYTIKGNLTNNVRRLPMPYEKELKIESSSIQLAGWKPQ